MRLRPRPFVVLTKARSGSKWLVELLDGHPEIAACGEMVYIDDVRTVLAGTRLEWMLRDPRRAQSAHAVR